MLKIRRDSEIYATEGGWFKAHWHFSFDQYGDTKNKYTPDRGSMIGRTLLERAPVQIKDVLEDPDCTA